MILLTGGSGQVGREVLNLLKKGNIPFLSPTSAEFPLDNVLEITKYLSMKNFTTVIHLAAETDVDYCELNATSAFLRNSTAVSIIGDYCAKNGAKLIFLSSSAVLSGGSNLMHSENSLFYPSNIYGETKMRAEEAISQMPLKYLVIRASWMLGYSHKGPKFAQVIFERIRRGESVSAVNDKFGSLTSAKRLADFIYRNLEFDESETVHVASNTSCSRYDIAKYIAHYLNKDITVNPVADKVFNLPAPRGLSEGLKSEKASEFYGYESLRWEDELQTFLKEIF